MAWRVKQGGSVLCDDGKLYKAGQMIPSDLLKPGQVTELVNSGYIEQASAPTGDDLVEKAPGMQSAPTLPGPQTRDGALDATTDKAKLVTTSPGGVTQSTAPISTAPATAKSLWVLDPAKLQGKSLDDLNIMVAERDASVAPFPTIPEAIAFLSADFNG